MVQGLPAPSVASLRPSDHMEVDNDFGSFIFFPTTKPCDMCSEDIPCTVNGMQWDLGAKNKHHDRATLA